MGEPWMFGLSWCHKTEACQKSYLSEVQLIVGNGLSLKARYEAGFTQVFCLSVPSDFSKFEFQMNLAKSVLTQKEVERFYKYKVQNRRNDLLLSRVLFQIILCKLGISATDSFWVEPDSNGKPFAWSKQGQAPFHINTSDTKGMIVWAVSRDAVLGCDVEFMGKDQDEIAKRHFAPQEVADYQALSGLDKKHRFFEIWTMKESVIKADGRGLAVALDSFYFKFDQPQPVYYLMDKENGPPPGPWQTLSYRPNDSHQVGVAVISPQPVVFDCHHLSLSNLETNWNQPWNFYLDSGQKNDITSAFSVFDPGDNTPP